MKKNTILSLLIAFTVISAIFYIINSNTSTAYGNTFSMPENSNSDDSYHSYNIQNKEKDNMNRYNINNNSSINNSNNNNVNNTTDTSDIEQENHFNNVYSQPTQNQTSKPKIKPVPKTKATTKPTIKPTNKPKQKSKPKNNNIKLEKIIQIEFSKHFIKLPVGSTSNVVLKTKPDKHSPTKLIYKSLDTSIATFNNKKITGLRKGFTTVFIMLPDETVKAACPVKVI